MRIIRAKEKKERALGVKLLLKPIRGQSAKAAILRKPYPPGVHGLKRKARKLSGYGRQLQEKQKLQITYGLTNKQLRRIFQKLQGPDEILSYLERRLDNVVFRLGLAKSRAMARQLVVHGHFLVNGVKVKSPSYQVRLDDEICIRPQSLNKKVFKDLTLELRAYQPPSWLELDKEKLRGKIISLPENISCPFDLGLIINYYSR